MMQPAPQPDKSSRFWITVETEHTSDTVPVGYVQVEVEMQHGEMLWSCVEIAPTVGQALMRIAREWISNEEPR